MGFLSELFSTDMAMVFWGAMFAQFLAESVFMPMLWSPRRFYATALGINKTPWEPPGYFTKNIIISLVMFLFMKYVCLAAFQVYTLRNCKKRDVEISSRYTNNPALAGVMIYILIYIIPLTRIPVIMVKSFIPFAQNLVYGIPMAFFVAFTYYIQRIIVLQEVCGF